MWRILIFSVLGLVLLPMTFSRPQQSQSQDNRSRFGTYDQASVTPIPIVRQFATSNPDGTFNSSYETANGIKVENSGYLKKIRIPQYIDENGKSVDEHEQLVLVQAGSYSYKDPDGNVISLSYIADENGFQPIGDHLPKVQAPPPQQLQGTIRNDTFFVQNRPIQPSNPSLGQEVSNQQSFPQFNSERPIQQFSHAASQQFQSQQPQQYRQN